ncbi:MAG: PIG-L family deacetylase [Bacteroidales bacterium]|nr:PIG-L family deacetylase [Bacteroidales bacterium]
MFNKTDPSYFDGEWSFEKTERAVLGLCKILDRYAHNLTLEDLQNDPRCARIPNLSLERVQEVIADVEAKLWRGAKPFENEVIYHTGPHHDDIMLGLMPLINRQLRSATNQVHFAIMTSGYHSVTDAILRQALEDTLECLRQDRIQMVHYPDFFEQGYRFKQEKDIHHYLDNVARKNPEEMRRGFCHRILRDAVGLWELKSVEDVEARFKTEIENLREGKANSTEIQKLKGQVREFEEELVWAYAGTALNHIHHLRLGLYDDKKTKDPDFLRDVAPILNQLRALKPTIITVAIDSEGQGPNTHYKVMQSIAEAVRLWNKEADLKNLRIFGYRNVWSTFHPAEANMYVPVSLNAFAVFEKAFKDSYLTQVKAEFPNPDFDGPFSELAESIWVKQYKDIQLILGKDFFYENEHPLIRATHGLIFLKEMTAEEFVDLAEEMSRRIENNRIDN